MLNLLKSTALLALIATLPTSSRAHTWSEELQVIGPNGSYIGDRGYMRGYVARTDPTFDGDATVLWLLPALDARMPDETVRLRINSSDYLCHPSQRTSNYTNPAYPKLKVAPGGYVAMKYLENGHVTLPWNDAGKPLQGGTAFVYGTTKPSPAEKIADVLQWNANGTGGDGRGWLMTAQTYDDGRCHQINSCVNSAVRQAQFPLQVTGQSTSPQQEQWCETDLKIPDNQALGDLTLYWVWQWTTQANADCTYATGKDEWYTSCADVEIVDGGKNDVDIVKEVATNTLLQECFQTTAVSTYKSRTALTASPTYILDNWNKVISNTSTASPAFTSSCSAVLSSVAANAGVPPPSCPAGLYATGDLYSSITSSVLAGPKTQIALITAAGPTGYLREVVPAAATVQGQSVNGPTATGGSASKSSTTATSSVATGSSSTTSSSSSIVTAATTTTSGGVATVQSTVLLTTTLTRVVTASRDVSAQSSSPTDSSSQTSTTSLTQTSTSSPTKTSSGSASQTSTGPSSQSSTGSASQTTSRKFSGGSKWGGGWGTSGGHSYHYNTIVPPAAPSNGSPPAKDVVARGFGDAEEHLDGHRRHARHFR